MAKKTINVSEDMLRRVLNHLMRGGTREDGPEREQLMLNLALAHPNLLNQDLLDQLENATPYPLYHYFPFPCAARSIKLIACGVSSYAVCEIWYRRLNDYKNIIKCYLNHPVRKVATLSQSTMRLTHTFCSNSSSGQLKTYLMKPLQTKRQRRCLSRKCWE